MTVKVNNAAQHLCEISEWKLSNLQIQKILYMADMNFVGQGHGRLVNENFEAWDYGPVIPSLYHKCKAFGSKPVPPVFWGYESITESGEAKILGRAWDALKSLSPGQLVETTHSSSGAWAKRYIPGATQIKISEQDMIDEYNKRQER